MGIAEQMTGKRTRKKETGAALVEGAIVSLAFFILVFGVFEVGRFLNTQQVLTNAAREGARWAVAPQAGTNNLPLTDVPTVVQNFLNSANINLPSPPVVTTLNAGSCWDTTTTCTEVQVQITYPLITGLPWFSALQVPLTGQAVMRNETSN